MAAPARIFLNLSAIVILLKFITKLFIAVIFQQFYLLVGRDAFIYESRKVVIGEICRSYGNRVVRQAHVCVVLHLEEKKRRRKSSNDGKNRQRKFLINVRVFLTEEEEEEAFIYVAKKATKTVQKSTCS